eukprot:CAMPEP_0117649784 /NCGR_PEP_ID=MMETSP0804-20121206/1178_1 /TAXON_ID=1074897 /ORGANISM="Tetraselmis astigmatica, Strain CCMP880" /LENGTH=701 /DNA_ID=CAMNT_0005455587 /DNA_START=542 /DNA_END=2644 /DNA_ORIENTATION=+
MNLRGHVLLASLLLVSSIQCQGTSTCRKLAVSKCKFLIVPESDIPIFPAGVRELSGFTGTCNRECVSHIEKGCVDEPGARTQLATMCKAFVCWEHVSKACDVSAGSFDFNEDKACSKQCDDALKSEACTDVEQVFPKFSEYKENLGPDTVLCNTKGCSNENVKNQCSKDYDADNNVLLTSALCDRECYDALFTRKCKSSQISVYNFSGQHLGQWRDLSALTDRYGPMSSYCRDTSIVAFTVGFEEMKFDDVDTPKQQKEFMQEVETHLSQVLVLLNTTSDPNINVSQIRPWKAAGGGGGSEAVKVDVVVTFFNDKESPKQLRDEVASDPGILFSPFGGVTVPPNTIIVDNNGKGEIHSDPFPRPFCSYDKCHSGNPDSWCSQSVESCSTCPGGRYCTWIEQFAAQGDVTPPPKPFCSFDKCATPGNPESWCSQSKQNCGACPGGAFCTEVVAPKPFCSFDKCATPGDPDSWCSQSAQRCQGCNGLFCDTVIPGPGTGGNSTPATGGEREVEGTGPGTGSNFTQAPTPAPTPSPTTAPTPSPSTARTPSPTASPTTAPTPSPTTFPTQAPTTVAPTPLPTTALSQVPTPALTPAPTTAAPTAPTTTAASAAPTAVATKTPSSSGAAAICSFNGCDPDNSAGGDGDAPPPTATLIAETRAVDASNGTEQTASGVGAREVDSIAAEPAQTDKNPLPYVLGGVAV